MRWLLQVRRLPWWLLVLMAGGVVGLIKLTGNPLYWNLFKAVAQGLEVTIGVAIVAYGLSAFLGLFLAILRSSPLRPLRELSTLYVETIRGLPMLVILYYIAFIGAPFLAQALNGLLSFLSGGLIPSFFSTRSFSFTTRAVLALVLGYSAFLSEIFRAGIESVSPQQTEAAQAIGMSRLQIMFHILIPQAVKNISPALVNEFVAIIKDSALVSVLGVQDITQIGKVYASSTFLFFETYNVVAFFYLCLTLSLSLFARRLERRLKGAR